MTEQEINISLSPAKRMLSKPVVSTLGCSLGTLSLLILARAICAAIGNQKLSELSSLYFMFGSSSVFIVNLIFGIIVAACVFFLAVGVFSARSGGSASLLKTSALTATVVTSVFMVISFASVSVLNYAQISAMASAHSDAQTFFIYNNNATNLFWVTILLGAALIMSEIGLIRLANSFNRNLTSGENVKYGTVILSIAALVGTGICAIVFCVSLYNLVTPSDLYRYSVANDLANAETFDTATLVLNCLNVAMYACAVVVLVAAAVIAFAYAASIDTINRSARGFAYNTMYTATDPQQYQDYTVPNNYNYNQTPTFTPVYDANRYYNTVNKNVYGGEVPPVPEPPVNPFKMNAPMTQYPAKQQVQPEAPAAPSADAEQAGAAQSGTDN